MVLVLVTLRLVALNIMEEHGWTHILYLISYHVSFYLRFVLLNLFTSVMNDEISS